MKAPERLVVRGVNWLGDAVMSIPALHRLRQALPYTHIALLTAEKLAELWRGQAAVDQVISVPKGRGVTYVRGLLREHNFQAALVFPNSFRSAFEPWLAGIPHRVGYAGGGRSLLLTHRVQPRREHIPMHKRTRAEVLGLTQTPGRGRETYPAGAHHLHQYLRLAAHFGASEQPLAPVISIASDEQRLVAEKLGIPSDRQCLGLNPGAEYGPAKRWPPERFVETARAVSARAEVQWVIFGGPGDRAAARQIASGLAADATPVLDLAGKTSLRELAVALSLCRVVLTNDTGPMHLAAAVGARVVVPFGSTSPELTGPGLPGDSRHALLRGEAPCAPCFLRACPIDLRCLQSISTDAVVQAVLRGLEDKGER